MTTLDPVAFKLLVECVSVLNVFRLAAFTTEFSSLSALAAIILFLAPVSLLMVAFALMATFTTLLVQNKFFLALALSATFLFS